jgi:hypothetical protein
MRPEAAEARFACASTQLLYVFGMFSSRGDDTAIDAGMSDRRRRCLGEDWIPMVRGLGAILSPAYDIISAGELGTMLTMGNWHTRDLEALEYEEDARFRSLAAAWHGDSDAKVYDDALLGLRKGFAFMQQFKDAQGNLTSADTGNGFASGPTAWLHSVGEVYFRLLRHRQPPALLIWAHYAVLLHVIDDVWFMKGWAYDTVIVVDDLLGDAWARWMKWPKHVCGVL